MIVVDDDGEKYGECLTNKALFSQKGFTWQRLILVGKKMTGETFFQENCEVFVLFYFFLFFQLFSYEKVLQPVLLPTCGSQPPMLNPKFGQKIIVADGKKYANNTIIYIYMK